MRELAAVTGKPPKQPAARLAAPKPISSRSGSTSVPSRAPKLRAVTMPELKATAKIAQAPRSMVSSGSPPGDGMAKLGSRVGMSPTTAMPWPRKSKAAESSTASTTTTSGPGTGKRAAFTPCSTASMAKASATEGQWMLPALRASSTKGRIRPSASIWTPVKRPIWPTRIESEMPMKKPVRIGRDRKLASTPSLSARASRQSAPTASASSAATATRSAPAAVAVTAASTAASTVIVAASGPTISFCDGPRSA